MGICRREWFDFWRRSSTGHSAGTRPASKPGTNKGSKQDRQSGVSVLSTGGLKRPLRLMKRALLEVPRGGAKCT